MKYCTTAEMAEKWNISDRRVRTLCKSGRIEGVISSNDTYLIPCDAVKPADGRCKAARLDKLAVAESVDIQYGTDQVKYYLKWQDDVIGDIYDNYDVLWRNPDYNQTVSNYTHGERRWSRADFERFVSERIVSSERRDIEKILVKCGLNSYDAIGIGLKTHAINSRDLLWIADSSDAKMDAAIDEVFRAVFVQKTDLEGDSISTPEGNNIKRYGVFNGRYGIYKTRLHPLSGDAESEVAVYKIAKLLGVPCCPAYRIDEDTVFSEFMYDWGQEYLVHARRLFMDEERGENEYYNLLSKRPQYQLDFIKMIALDFITRQDDRHLSNVAVLLNATGETFYPLYDNGRSLFYEDTEETARKACDNIGLYSTTWGASGTYYDYVNDIASTGVSFARILNLGISDDEIYDALVDAGFTGYRLKYGCEWIRKTVNYLKSI